MAPVTSRSDPLAKTVNSPVVVNRQMPDAKDRQEETSIPSVKVKEEVSRDASTSSYHFGGK